MASVIRSRPLAIRPPGTGVLRRLASFFGAQRVQAASPAQSLYGDSADIVAGARGLRAMELKRLIAKAADRR